MCAFVSLHLKMNRTGYVFLHLHMFWLSVTKSHMQHHLAMSMANTVEDDRLHERPALAFLPPKKTLSFQLSSRWCLCTQKTTHAPPSSPNNFCCRHFTKVLSSNRTHIKQNTHQTEHISLITSYLF